MKLRSCQWGGYTVSAYWAVRLAPRTSPTTPTTSKRMPYSCEVSGPSRKRLPTAGAPPQTRSAVSADTTATGRATSWSTNDRPSRKGMPIVLKYSPLTARSQNVCLASGRPSGVRLRPGPVSPDIGSTLESPVETTPGTVSMPSSAAFRNAERFKPGYWWSAHRPSPSRCRPFRSRARRAALPESFGAAGRRRPDTPRTTPPRR